MSGSGGGSGYLPSSQSDCNSLSIKTQLASPKAVIIAQLSIGDLLDVVLSPPAGPVQIITSNGDIAGAILSPDIAALITCMNDGHSYQAEVLDIRGGNCQVLITHI